MNIKTDLKLSAHWNLAYTAHSNTSFSPEKRADSIIKDYSVELEEDLKTLNNQECNYEEKYINHFTTWLHAKSRCISSMITGPANFPVARAEKANSSEHNKYEAFRHWREKYFKAVNRVRTPSPEEDLDNALNDLEVLIRKQELMKLTNKIMKKHIKKGIEAVKQALLIEEIPVSWIEEATTPNSYGDYGFARFQLTNNNAKIKARKQKVEAMKVRIERKLEWEDIKFEGGYITIEDDRVKVCHDEKPDQEIINQLKKNGFRWSRHWGCWCRKHTGNAVYTARCICTPEVVKAEEVERRKKAEEARTKEKNKTDEIMTKHGAFWAFGNAQFDEQKKEGVKYVQVYSGLICPKDTVEQLIDDLGLKRKKKSA